MKRLFLPLAFLLLGTALPARAAVDPFYTSLLRDGMHAYDRKDYVTAVRDLRLACFGMLDDAKALTDCLARLALAQDRAEDLEGFRETFRRLTEVEERFATYSQGTLAPELRSVLDQRLAARIPANTLESVPAFRGLTKAAAPAGGTEPAPVQTAAPAPAIPPPASPAPAVPKPLSSEEQDKMAQVRKLLDAPKASTRDLKQAYQLARDVAGAHPEAKDAQYLAGEAAYRLSNWSEAAAWFRRGGDPGEDEPELLFYLAVSLYKTGDQAGAAATMRRAIPKLQKTPFVEEYERRILGQ